MSAKGFTKIEILIVIVVILLGIFIDILVISYLNNKAQDIKTLSEVDQIRGGLEVYLQAHNYYPEVKEPLTLNNSYLASEKLCYEGFRKKDAECERDILNPIPNYYVNSGNIYIYKSNSDNSNYQLEFSLKTNFRNQGLISGKQCADNTQIISKTCF